ncbi:kinase-like protein [Leucogyrophana mollusca]|uniref:Kinase-like protein n=1 Tax=Leucogyrophana mollusca TaxID=85980 RepID=A0ACB8BW87_9AGAM|nr:kinase-like protein [Leucogyrophana mollusca]
MHFVQSGLYHSYPRTTSNVDVEAHTLNPFIIQISTHLIFLINLIMVCLSSSLPDFSGQVIDNGRYHLLHTLGSGAYGVVYRALDTTSDPLNPTHYAIKCMAKAELTHEQLAYQNREIALHKIVSGSSPFVLSLHEIVEEELYLYLILDLCPGGDMFSAITKTYIYHNNIPLMKQAFIELLDGVQACHDRGVFHRDLKPENILCGKDGAGILVADFGLATQKRVCKDFGCGSAEYMSPECLSREIKYPHYSPRHTDIWSLGVILINLVFSRNPWRLATTSDSGFLSFLYNPDYLRDVLPISRGLNDVMKRVFHLNPAARISIPELREEILKMDTFYMSHEEMLGAAEHARDFARANRRNRTPITKLVVHHVDTDETLIDDSDDSDDWSSSSSSDADSHPDWSYDSAEQIMALAASRSIPPPPSFSSDGPSIRLVLNSGPRRENFIIGSDSGSGSLGSEPESEGPVTPETIADDLATDVPDLDLAEGDGFDQTVVADDIMANARVKNAQIPPTLIRNAAQQLRAY